MLRGLSQKGTVVGTGALTSPVVDTQDHRRISRAYPITAQAWNVVSPLSSRRDSLSQGRLIGQRVQECGKSEGPSVMAGIGGASQDDTLPAQAGRLPQGLSSRENLANG
jgi:hypothetical protein